MAVKMLRYALTDKIENDSKYALHRPRYNFSGAYRACETAIMCIN